MKKIKYILLGIGMLLSMALQAHELLPYPLDTIKGQVYYRYPVPRGIGVYRISVNFGVSQEAILKANPHLMTRGVHVDEIILVPAKIEVTQQQPVIAETIIPSNPPILKDTLIADQKFDSLEAKNNIPSQRPQRRNKKAIRDSIAQAIQDSILKLDSLNNDSSMVNSSSHVIRLAVMLPLYADAIKRDKNIDRFFDFYTGTLLAINKIQQEGQKIEVFTYDIDKTARATQLVMQDSTWQKVDAIIGPAYPQQVAEAVKYAAQDSTWILVPFLPTLQEVKNNPYILKFNPSPEVVAETMAEYLSALGDSVNCVLLETKETERVPTSIIHLHKALKAHKVPTITTTIRQIYTDSIDSVFVAGKENIIIFNTENYNNLHALIPNLLHATQRYHITLYSQYSWSQENILLPQIYTSAFNETLLVPAQYQTHFNTYFGHRLSATLPRYDLLGYDLTLHLLHMLQQAYAEDTDTLPTDNEWIGTLTTIQYKKVSAQGGFENQTVHVIRK